MMSLETIRRVNREAGREAAQKNRRPYVPWNLDEIREWPPFPFPNLGDYVPEGWELVMRFFVDKDGRAVYGGTPAVLPAQSPLRIHNLRRGRISTLRRGLQKGLRGELATIGPQFRAVGFSFFPRRRGDCGL